MMTNSMREVYPSDQMPNEALPPAYIENLPPELLRRIFIWTKACETAEYTEPYPLHHTHRLQGPPLSMLRSHVSRRWREIALSCQELWNDWPRYGRAGHWTDICYARSLDVPLDLRIIISKTEVGPDERVWRDLALGELARARTLVIELYGPQGLHAVMRGFEDALDAVSRCDKLWLESLTLKNRLRKFPTHILLPPASLAPGNAPPRLHTVVIHDFDLRSSDKIWSDNLCVLELLDAYVWRTVDEMIDFFRAVPNLEELTYQYDHIHDKRAAQISDFSASAKHPIRSVPLPRLKRFYLLNESDEMRDSDNHFGAFLSGISMFSYLSLPSSVILDMRADMLEYIHWPLQWDDATDAHTLSGPIAQNLVLGAAALQAHFADAQAKGQSYDAITVRDRTIQPDLTRQISNSSMLPSALTLVLPHFDVQGRSGGVSKVACTMYLSIPVFKGATELDVRRTYGSRPFLHRFPTFPAVRILILSRKAVKDFVQPPRFSSYAEIFPALEVIRFKDFDCDEHVEPVLPPGPRPNAYERLKFHVALLDTLAECDQAGSCKTWRRIEFEGCANGESVVEKIREDVRLIRLNERVMVVCNDSEDYEPHGSSDDSFSTRSVHWDEEE